MIPKSKIIIFFCIVIIAILIIGCINKPSEPNEEARLQPLPSSAEILFVSNLDTGDRTKEIYSMDANGGNITRITFTGDHHRILGIDRTKRYIAVTRIDKDTNPPSGLGDEDRKSLWILDLETREEKQLTNPNNNAEGDSFSPDGEWIVFYMILSGDIQSDIYKIRRDGTNLTRLTYTEDASESDPSWSNDGNKIAFVSFSADTPRFVLKVMNTDGSNVRTIYDSGDTISTPYFQPGVYDPSWSPDDQWIVFEKPVRYSGQNGDAGVWHVFKIHPDGTGLVDLSEAGGHTDMAEYLPSFSGDGEFIVFSARYGSPDPAQVQINIFKMDKNGGSLERLTSNPTYEDFAVWIR